MIVLAVAAVLVIGVIGVVLLYLAAQGQMPTALGLLDMNQTGNRVMVVVALLIVVAVLAFVYQRARRKDRGDRVDHVE